MQGSPSNEEHGTPVYFWKAFHSTHLKTFGFHRASHIGATSGGSSARRDAVHMRLPGATSFLGHRDVFQGHDVHIMAQKRNPSPIDFGTQFHNLELDRDMFCLRFLHRTSCTEAVEQQDLRSMMVHDGGSFNREWCQTASLT